jgi:imidazoleglycerol-phosphate dehydratase
MSRYALIERKTLETSIRLEIDLDSRQKSVISSGVDFFDHMLNSMSKHGRFYMNLSCKGDTHVDDHHTVEDIGICLGMAFREALGTKAGIRRFGYSMIPMDDALAVSVIDLSGRAYFRYTGSALSGHIKNYSEDLTIEFLRSFSDNAAMNLHVELKSGDNRHHIHEAIFKSVGVALRSAVSMDPDQDGEIPSTKGVIS